MSRPPANAAPLPDDATGESSAFARLDPRIQQFLWREGWTELRAALDLGETMARSLEARSRAHFGIDAAAEPRAPEQIW